MSKIISLITIFFLHLYSCHAQADNNSVILEYEDDGDIYVIDKDSYYDTNVKPLLFKVKASGDSKRSVIVDVFRIMRGNEDSDEERLHYFKTEYLVKAERVGSYYEYQDAIDVTELFRFNKTRFYRTAGLLFKICLIENKTFIDIRDTSDCIYLDTISLRYQH